MGEQVVAGLCKDALVDDEAKAQKIRQAVLEFSEKDLQQVSSEDRKVLEMQVSLEMKDDPQWKHKGRWDWPKYFEHAKKPKTFGTYYNIAKYVAKTGNTMVVYQMTSSGLYFIANQTDGSLDKGTILLLRAGKHFDLLLPAEAPQGLPAATKGTPMKRPAASICVDKQSSKTPKKAPRKQGEEKSKKAEPKSTKKSEAQREKEKQARLLKARLEKPAPFGRCWRPGCQASLKPVPPPAGEEPSIGCPRFSSGLCKGYIRMLRPGEECLLPKRICFMKNISND